MRQRQRTAATKTLFALEHHAKDLREAALYMFSMAGMLGWKMISVRGGPNSWRLIKPNGEVFRVSGRPSPWRIEITNPVGSTALLSTRTQVVRWFEKN